MSRMIHDRFAYVLICCLTVALSAGCGSVEPPADEDTAVDEDVAEDGESNDIESDAATTDSGSDTGTAGDVAEDAATKEDTATAADSEDTVEDTGTSDPDATDEDATEADTTETDTGVPPKKLPLPDCAKNCTECSKCPDTTMCLDGKTYNNDCEAICDLQAFEWPVGFEPSQGKCPDCSFCQPDEPEVQYCATLKNGGKVTVNALCETKCLDLDDNVGINPLKGPCKSKCSFGTDQGGGGCSVTAYQPVCAKNDGSTYQTQCAMDNCDLQGCYALGATSSTPQCEPTKMTVECPGECYDAKKWSTCPGECAPVCAVTTAGKGVSFRNGCIANAEGAKILSCTGVSATSKDQCSASLYGGGNKGCCPDVDYSVVKQICASKGTSADAQWMTFRSQSEFDCLVGDEKALWNFQYQGPCICNCPQNEKPVCGDDGLTYQNACQAKCYNGDTFNWKDGACK